MSSQLATMFPYTLRIIICLGQNGATNTTLIWHSAPCFLNFSPDTVEWILVHSYHIPALLYYLDHLITDALPPPPDSKPCLYNFSTALAVCKQLGLPLHLGKYQGPATVLAVLGFELDSVDQAACLPADKLLALQGLISLCLPQKCSTFNRGQ